MRGLILLAVFAAIIAAMAVSPFSGLLGWAWFSFMHPHRETFGFTNTFSFDWYIAVLTMLGWIFSRDQKFVPLGATPILSYSFAAWICITTYFAIDSNLSYDLWERTEKSLILVIFVMMMTTTIVRLHAFVWVIAISLGYFAVKGAGFVLLAGGGNVYGPEDSMIRDNNHLGVALACTIPLFIYLFRTSSNGWVRLGTAISIASIIITIVGTFSRGGFLALLAVGGLMAIRSRAKMSVIAAGLLALVLISQFAPESWWTRIQTIGDYQADVSAQLRFQAWNAAWNVAVDRPLTGGGFSWSQNRFAWDRYSDLPAGSPAFVAHSIYFQVLGEHGFVGFSIYMLLVLTAIRNTQISARIARQSGGLSSVREMSNALQLAIVSMMLGGVSLSLAYYDMFLSLVGLTYALRRIAERHSLSHTNTNERTPSADKSSTH